MHTDGRRRLEQLQTLSSPLGVLCTRDVRLHVTVPADDGAQIQSNCFSHRCKFLSVCTILDAVCRRAELCTVMVFQMHDICYFSEQDSVTDRANIRTETCKSARDSCSWEEDAPTLEHIRVAGAGD